MKIIFGRQRATMFLHIQLEFPLLGIISLHAGKRVESTREKHQKTIERDRRRRKKEYSWNQNNGKIRW